MSPAAEDPMYDRAPRIVIWEMTRACALSCRHCRAAAIPRRNPLELTTTQAYRLLEDIASCNRPLVVLTGGDPLMRDDIYKIIAYGTSLQLPIAVAPSATGRLTRDAIRRLATAGVRRISLSLDAPDAESHDAFRGVKGSHKRTLEAIEYAHEFGVSVQVNTTVSQHNRTRLMEFETLLAQLDIVLWSVFFVLPLGRAGAAMCLDADQTEEAFGDIFTIASRSPFEVKTTEAPHYRRYVAQHASTAPRERTAIIARSGQRFKGIGDGRGFVFISHTGDVEPSGFLPLTVGNVKKDRLLDLYRNHPTMQRLRKPDTFNGKCGTCDFRAICGGSRSRAFLTSQDPYGSDPSCSYVAAAR